MAINCGHCPNSHNSVQEVRDCWEWENQPQEVCCFSCDALIGWVFPPDTIGERRGCGGPEVCRRDFPASFTSF